MLQFVVVRGGFDNRRIFTFVDFLVYLEALLPAFLVDGNLRKI